MIGAVHKDIIHYSNIMTLQLLYNAHCYIIIYYVYVYACIQSLTPTSSGGP